MPKHAVFSMKLEPELREQFMAEAKVAHRSASQLVRELMREYVVCKREEREYQGFLQGKVDTARVSMQTDRDRPNDEIEAKFAARRAAADQA